MKNIPKKIYLQVGEEDSDSDDFDKIKLNSGVTWCWDRINRNDLVFEYRSQEKETKMSNLCKSCGSVHCQNYQHCQDYQNENKELLEMLKTIALEIEKIDTISSDTETQLWTIIKKNRNSERKKAND